MATAQQVAEYREATQSLVLPRMRGTATAIFFLGATLIGLAFGPFMAGLVSEMTGSLAIGVMANVVLVPLGLVALYVAIRGYPAAETSRIARAAGRGELITSG